MVSAIRVDCLALKLCCSLFIKCSVSYHHYNIQSLCRHRVRLITIPCYIDISKLQHCPLVPVKKWGLAESPTCECGESEQTAAHIINNYEQIQMEDNTMDRATIHTSMASLDAISPYHACSGQQLLSIRCAE